MKARDERNVVKARGDNGTEQQESWTAGMNQVRTSFCDYPGYLEGKIASYRHTGVWREAKAVGVVDIHGIWDVLRVLVRLWWILDNHFGGHHGNILDVQVIEQSLKAIGVTANVRNRRGLDND